MVIEQALYRTGERPGGPLAVSTAGLTKRFGDRAVVADVALAIPSGSVCGFVGPNGAGKTTTIRMLLGLVRPRQEAERSLAAASRNLRPT